MNVDDILAELDGSADGVVLKAYLSAACGPVIDDPALVGRLLDRLIERAQALRDSLGAALRDTQS